MNKVIKNVTVIKDSFSKSPLTKKIISSQTECIYVNIRVFQQQ